MAKVYHSGEIAVQERAGVRTGASRVANGIRDFLLPAAREFLETQPFVVASVTDEQGDVWALPLRGPLVAIDDRTIRVPETLSGSVGLVIMDFATRRRMRVNGDAENGVLSIAQCYANCPKYIQKRENAPIVPAIETGTVSVSERIHTADTFFIATRHPIGGADASHRGGNPGFVTVVGNDTLLWQDYPGNTMFNTLGNLAEDPNAGLLFPDFTTGNALLLSGTAELLWDADGERTVRFTVRRMAEMQDAFAPFDPGIVEYSPFNPIVG